MTAGVTFPDDGHAYLEPVEPTPAERDELADAAEDAEAKWRWGR